MNSSNKMNNVLLVLLSASVIATIGTIFYHFVDTSYETETAIRAHLQTSPNILRACMSGMKMFCPTAEQVLSATRCRTAVKLPVNDVIAEVYPDESAIEKEQQIKALQDKLNVLERISNPGTLEQAQPADLSRQISQYYEKIVQSRNSGDLTELSSAQQQFVESYSTYQIVISKGEVSFAQEISDLTAQIQALQSEQETPIDTVKSDSSAYFVSHVDGLESKLSIENLANITPEQIQEITKNSNDNTTQTSQNSNVVGKTIAQYGWYMLGIIDNKEQKYQVGDSVKIRLMTSSATADATIKELRSTSEDGKFMVVLYSDTLTSDFVQNRTENVERFWANMRASRFREMRSGSRMWKRRSQTKRREKRKSKPSIAVVSMYRTAKKSNSGVWMWFMREMIMFSQSSTQAMVI